MTDSMAWDWEKEESLSWLRPSEECYYLAEKWKTEGVSTILDLGSGLGRHAIFFAKKGFEVTAMDLSDYGVEHLKRWAEREGCKIKIDTGDILKLPYEDNTFDCVFSYHVIFHTDSTGIIRIIDEIKRVLKPHGKIFLTFGSKETWAFKDAGYPKIDENTVIKTEEGPENGIPHFYVDTDDIFTLLKDFNIERIRHTDDCYYDGQRRNSKHYYISGTVSKYWPPSF